MKIRVGKIVYDKPRTFTVSQLTESIRKNGIPQTKMSWWKGHNGVSVSSSGKFDGLGQETEAIYTVGSACAMGQAAVNLGVDYGSLDYQLGRLRLGDGLSLGGIITRLNDVDSYTYQQIADYIEKNYADGLGNTFTLDTYHPVEILSED